VSSVNVDLSNLLRKSIASQVATICSSALVSAADFYRRILILAVDRNYHATQAVGQVFWLRTGCGNPLQKVGP